MKSTRAMKAWILRNLSVYRRANSQNPRRYRFVPPMPPPMPVIPRITRVKRSECGPNVTLTDQFQDLIQKLRTYAPKVAIALGAISHMLSGRRRPEGETAQGGTSTWEDDYWLIKHPLGTQWKLSLWSGLQDIKIKVGLLVGAYQPVYNGPFFARNEKTWPDQGKDPRAEVEYIRNILDCTGDLIWLTNEADQIRDSQMSCIVQ
ncbi:hypothetical protein B0H13DRAFT_2664610 [Mycena leptocephala]|nr:hypothetical protein B0H13DRAFT_2664610 [Mycena leptocephala]